jgi:hypothetical protein
MDEDTLFLGEEIDGANIETDVNKVRRFFEQFGKLTFKRYKKHLLLKLHLPLLCRASIVSSQMCTNFKIKQN